MARYYTYLVSSLPALSFGAKPPLSFERLIALCAGMIPDEDIEILKGVLDADSVPCGHAQNRTLTRWRSFETMVRNELVMVRSARHKLDPVKYLRKDGCPESVHAAHIAINAYRKPSMLEAEKALDLERWNRLDELTLGHYFDLDVLIIYALKLSILQKWDRIHTADKRRLLEETLAAAER